MYLNSKQCTRNRGRFQAGSRVPDLAVDWFVKEGQKSTKWWSVSTREGEGREAASLHLHLPLATSFSRIQNHIIFLNRKFRGTIDYRKHWNIEDKKCSPAEWEWTNLSGWFHRSSAQTLRWTSLKSRSHFIRTSGRSQILCTLHTSSSDAF